jgi:hypothetical protein
LKREAEPGISLLDNGDASVRFAVLSVGSSDYADNFGQEEFLSRREAEPGISLLDNGVTSVRNAVLSRSAGVIVLTTLNRKSLFRSARLSLVLAFSTTEMHL